MQDGKLNTRNIKILSFFAPLHFCNQKLKNIDPEKIKTHNFPTQPKNKIKNLSVRKLGH